MKSVRILILLCIYPLFLFLKCENEPVDIKPVNPDYLLGRIYRGEELYLEYIYNDNKKLIRVDYYNNDSVYFFESYEYNSDDKVNMKNYSDNFYETYEYDESGRYIKLNLHDNDSSIYEVIEFTYNTEGRIEKGLVIFNDVDTRDIIYEYDSRGNVIKRIEGDIEGSQFALSTSEYEYDDMNNPRYNWGLPTDVIQFNNPVRHYNENMLSCAMPPNFEFEYEYNIHGYPVTEIRKWVWSEAVDTFYYEYLK